MSPIAPLRPDEDGGEPDTKDDEMARDDAPEPEWDDHDDG